MLKLYNSLSRKIEDFKPIKDNQVGMYVCGPTVYHFVHIGNLRTYLLSDLLRRVLEYEGLTVDEIMNITDVGHLTGDQDFADDKMEKEAKTADDVAKIVKKYTTAFGTDIKNLNIRTPNVMPEASNHIKQQIEIIQKLIEKGFAYESDEAVYFDVDKFPNYNQLVGQKLEDMKLGARQDVVKDSKKKNPIDFVLWFKAVGRYEHHIQVWDSPWGKGFPGWHIECSAMSQTYLGNHFDIHVGGIDLKFPHHTNEIAQSEAANGEKFVNYWIHGEHLLINEGRMGKSEGNFITLQTLIDKGINPLAYRYLILTAHYRSKLNFTWESLTASQNALNNLYEEVSGLDPASTNHVENNEFEKTFLAAINDDLDMPKALATVWELIKSDEIKSADKAAALFKFDTVLGLNLKEIWTKSRPSEEIKNLAQAREEARKSKDFAKSDEFRKQIEAQGFVVDDTLDGFRLKKKF